MKKYLIAYILFLIFFVIFSLLFIDPNFPYQIPQFYAFSLWNRTVVTFYYIFLVTLSFFFYIKWLQFVREKSVSGSTLKKVLLLTAVFFMFSYPALSYDIFNYIATAKVTFQYKENPYVIMPYEISNEPLLKFMHAANKTALYGPVWILLTAIPLLTGFGNLLVTIASFRLFVILFFLATCWLLWKMTEKNLFLTSLFACNPLVVIETMINGHNDIIMIFLFLSGVFMLTRKRFFVSFILLFLSVLIKFASLFLTPVFLYVLFLYFLKKKIVWQKVYLLMLFSMLVIFFLSPLREEMYPWYAQWFLAFIPLLSHKKLIVFFSIIFSSGLLLRYVPFLFLRTYDYPTPLLRTLFALAPLVIGFLLWRYRKKSILHFLS